MNGENYISKIISLIVLILIGWWIYSTYINTDYSKTWWSGTQNQKMCSMDYDNKCYTLPVSSEGGAIDRVDWPNGGYIIPTDSECSEAASFYDFDRFCTIWVSDGTTWDIIPL